MDSLVVGKLVTTINLAISFSELNGCSMERRSICQRSVGYQQLRDGLRRLRAALGMPGAVGWVMERLEELWLGPMSPSPTSRMADPSTRRMTTLDGWLAQASNGPSRPIGQ